MQINYIYITFNSAKTLPCRRLKRHYDWSVLVSSGSAHTLTRAKFPGTFFFQVTVGLFDSLDSFRFDFRQVWQCSPIFFFNYHHHDSASTSSRRLLFDLSGNLNWNKYIYKQGALDEDLVDLVISYEWSDTLVWLLCPDGYSLRLLAFVNASGSTQNGRTCRTSP